MDARGARGRLWKASWGSLGRLLVENAVHDRVHRLKDFLPRAGVLDHEAELLLEGDDELERVDGIQPDPVRAEQRSVVADFLGLEFQHQRADKGFPDFLLQIFSIHAADRTTTETCSLNPTQSTSSASRSRGCGFASNRNFVASRMDSVVPI